jgi:hypothetical protein
MPGSGFGRVRSLQAQTASPRARARQASPPSSDECPLSAGPPGCLHRQSLTAKLVLTTLVLLPAAQAAPADTLASAWSPAGPACAPPRYSVDANQMQPRPRDQLRSPWIGDAAPKQLSSLASDLSRAPKERDLRRALHRHRGWGSARVRRLNARIHQANECVAVEDLALLSAIDRGLLERLLAAEPA